ncbi:hypothetical protein CAS74_003694 [Pichia kudriavzevii]|uniref:TAFII28-like protein domain-containing protein n=1 Tax=Pichia kudriavzevii TaxID=4909 RepID=A0A1Z8JLX0_PICKU|nr:hypothetical protein CAS74_003694 [Pichia kudriavzevii]
MDSERQNAELDHIFGLGGTVEEAGVKKEDPIVAANRFLHEREEEQKTIRRSQAILAKLENGDEDDDDDDDDDDEDENDDDDDDDDEEEDDDDDDDEEDDDDDDEESDSGNYGKDKRMKEAQVNSDESIGDESEDEDPVDKLLREHGLTIDDVPLELTLNEQRKLLVDSMDEEQLTRYEFFRRTNLNSGGIKKLVNAVCSVSVNNDFAKLLAGVGKVFVGEIVTLAKEEQRLQQERRVREILTEFEKIPESQKQQQLQQLQQLQHIQQLTPEHIRAAWYRRSAQHRNKSRIHGVKIPHARSTNRRGKSLF